MVTKSYVTLRDIAMRSIVIVLILTLTQTSYGQGSINDLLHHKKFRWLADSSSAQVTLYYQAEGWTSTRLESIKQRMSGHIDSVKSFIKAKSYDSRIHLFIVESREQMKALIGREVNGTAFYKHHTITGIASEKIKSIFSNHEFFHVIAMNLWGVPDLWINEGMAVYADKKWRNYDLHQLSKYLVDNNRYASLDKLIKEFRSVDDLISYPLIGSFVKYIDETYGRDVIIKIWQGNHKTLKRTTGKRIQELEQDWLAKIRTSEYKEISY